MAIAQTQACPLLSYMAWKHFGGIRHARGSLVTVSCKIRNVLQFSTKVRLLACIPGFSCRQAEVFFKHRFSDLCTPPEKGKRCSRVNSFLKAAKNINLSSEDVLNISLWQRVSPLVEHRGSPGVRTRGYARSFCFAMSLARFPHCEMKMICLVFCTAE